jgi:hypothetical protein
MRSLSLILCTLLFCGVATSQERAGGPVAHWTFDQGNAGLTKDSVASHVAIANGARRPTTFNPKKHPLIHLRRGRTVLLQPTLRIDLTLPTALTADRRQFSFTWWINTIEDRGGKGDFHENPTMLGNRMRGVGGDFGVMTRRGYLGYWTGLGGSDITFVSKTVRLNNKRWRPIALTSDGIRLKLYADGKAISEGLRVGGRLGAGAVHFGSCGNHQPAFTPQFHAGAYDDLRIYHRALSAAEVAALARGQLVPSTKSSRLAASPELRMTVPRGQLAQLGERPGIQKMLDVINLGTVEGAAKAAWQELLRGLPATGEKIPETTARRATAALAAFENEHGESKLAAAVSAERDALKRRLAATISTAATVYWLMADDMDIYHNGKPLRDYEPTFRTRRDEARKTTAFSAKIVLRPGDVFTIGGRRGGSYGGTVVVVDEDNRLVWCSNLKDWRVYEPADPERWYLPKVAMQSKRGPVRLARGFGHQARMKLSYGGIPQPIWGEATQRIVFMVGVYRRAEPAPGP